jgi:uncharacterized protein (DUF302 family)
MAQDGLVTVRSRLAAADTVHRIKAALAERGLTLFAAIDHAAGAREAGLTLRPTTLLIFGNAKAGTPLMQSAQSIGIDLPLRMLVTEDASGATWVSYNDLAWIAHRHGIDPATQPSLKAMAALLATIAAVTA